MKEIPLTQGKVALVDDEDYEWLSQYNWHVEKIRHTYYAKRNTWINGKAGTFFMHREIMGLRKNDGKICDHKDRNGLHNQRENLRITSRSLNGLNCKIHNHNTSGYRGVSWDKKTKNWQAYITIKRKKIHLGRHVEIRNAALAHDIAAIKHYGENATLNFPQGDTNGSL